MKGTPITPQLYDYIAGTFAAEDDLLKRMPAEAERQGIPMIHIDPVQGKLLQVLMRACSARRVIEVGSLFGYSAIWMARALPADGLLIALEIEPKHVRVIRDNARRAGLADKIEVIEGDAHITLPALASRAPFDFAFIDADKPGYLEYYEAVMSLLRPGGILVADNMSANGTVWQGTAGRASAIHALNQRMATDPRLTSLLLPVSDGMCVGVVHGSSKVH